ncbi:MAG: DUF3048 domain-containing protein [Acidimicrobiales bacterium]
MVRLLALVFAVGLVVAACSGDDDDVAEPTTTTTTSTTTSSTTTTTEAPTLSLLTGREIDDPEILDRPVVAAKIASDRDAQPQVGLDVADVVVEELVEGGISRYLAIFQSVDSDPVGPMRSARTSEIELLPIFGRPIFAHSGGNSGTMGALRNANTSVNAGPDTPFGNLQLRDSSRRRPNNLFTNTSLLREAAAADASPPEAWFAFLGEDDEPSAQALPVVGVDVSFGTTRTRWVWDEERQAFLRFHNGTPHLAPDDQQLGFETVIVLNTPYGTSAADVRSPEAITIGAGDGWVLSNGWVAAISWERPERHAPITLRDADGEELALSPGRIWMALPRAGSTTFLDADPR